MARNAFGFRLKPVKIKPMGFGLSPEKKGRKSPTRSLKNLIWEKQHGKCWKCHKPLSPSYAEYHHKNGRRSDTRKGNLAVVCSNCHKILSNEQRVRGKGRRGIRRGGLSGSLKIKPIKFPQFKI